MWDAYVIGLGTGLGLIVVIGMQNTFVLTQGMARNKVFLIPLVCFICDAALLALGIGGLGLVISQSIWLMAIAALGGVGFLGVYGLRALKAALKPGRLETGSPRIMTAREALLATLGITLLNPQVYLDTVVFMGSRGAVFADLGKCWFWAGATTASLVWFFALSLGGRLLAPFLAKPLAWRIIQGVLGIFLCTQALGLAMQVPGYFAIAR